MCNSAAALARIVAERQSNKMREQMNGFRDELSKWEQRIMSPQKTCGQASGQAKGAHFFASYLALCLFTKSGPVLFAFRDCAALHYPYLSEICYELNSHAHQTHKFHSAVRRYPPVTVSSHRRGDFAASREGRPGHSG